MSFAAISAGLKTLLDSITEVKDVFAYPVDPFTEKDAVAEWPVAFIVESGNDNDYASTRDNLRTYAYEIWLCHKVDNGSLSEGVTTLRVAMDAVIDRLDVEGIAATPLSNSCINIEPIPSSWNIEARSENLFELTATIRVKCHTTKQLQ